MKTLLSLFTLLFTFTVFAQVKDIDDNTYKTVKIGQQIWMAENLNVSHFLNGDEIYQAKTDEEWIKANEERKPAWCYYESNEENGVNLGRLYNWYAVNDSRGLAPEGWHVSTDNDWKNLEAELGKKRAAKKLMSKDMWAKRDDDEVNVSGFSAQQGGRRNQNCLDGSGITKMHFSEKTSWWTSSKYYSSTTNKTHATAISLIDDYKTIIFKGSPFIEGFYVRCVKDK